ncbi:unnamed protein product [Heterobilharzia americana]|nr:unnamed protein product [Heterobilharzia americana]
MNKCFMKDSELIFQSFKVFYAKNYHFDRPFSWILVKKGNLRLFVQMNNNEYSTLNYQVIILQGINRERQLVTEVRSNDLPPSFGSNYYPLTSPFKIQ